MSWQISSRCEQIKKEDLMKSIQISESVKAKLPDSVVERLKDVILAECLRIWTHPFLQVISR